MNIEKEIENCSWVQINDGRVGMLQYFPIDREDIVAVNFTPEDYLYSNNEWISISEIVRLFSNNKWMEVNKS